MRYLALSVVLLAACAGKDFAHEVGDSGSSSDLAEVAADSGNSCAIVDVFPVDATAPAMLTAVATAASGEQPTWMVATPDGVVTPVALDGTGLRVQVAANDPGTYSFQVSFPSGTPCPGSNSVQVIAPQAAYVSYRLRFTPPASSALPQQDTVITVAGGTPQTDADVLLTAGTALGGVLRGPSGALAGEVQLLPQDGPEVDIVVDTSGFFSLPIQVDATYSLALIPSDITLAPRLIGPDEGSTLLGLSFDVDPGVVITGAVRDPSMQPLSGAGIVLRAGPLPSGLGTSAADGSYSLHAEPATLSLAASVAGWPDVSLAGVVIGAGGATLDVDQLLARQGVTLAVVRADGITAVSGAQLALRSRTLAAAASVVLNGVAQPASGVMRAQGTSASDGTITTQLPAATYDVLVTPPVGITEGPTGVALALSSGTVTVTLAAPLPLAGLVHDAAGKPVAGASVEVLSPEGVVLAGATTDASGHFGVSLEAGVPTDLEIDPPASAPLAAARVHLGATDGTLGGALPSSVDVALPAGLALGGVVRGPSAAPLADVTVDLLCLSCGDSTPLATTQSDATGRYTLAVPDPGLVEIDGGDDGP